jgi:hypothetical protein
VLSWLKGQHQARLRFLIRSPDHRLARDSPRNGARRRHACLRLEAVLRAVPRNDPGCHHGGLGLHTAADVDHGHATAVRAERADVLTAAWTARPERFVRKPPTPPKLPAGSWINPPEQKETTTQ